MHVNTGAFKNDLWSNLLNEIRRQWEMYVSTCLLIRHSKQRRTAHSPTTQLFLLYFFTLYCAFVVALFRQCHAKSQHLFPSRVALIFGWDLVLTMGKWNDSVKSTPANPQDFNNILFIISAHCSYVVCCLNSSSSLKPGGFWLSVILLFISWKKKTTRKWFQWYCSLVPL